MGPRCLLALGMAVLRFGWAAGDTELTEPKAFKVPYRLTDAHHVLVRAKINGKGPFNFIIDTGAPALFVATKICKKLGIAKDKDGWGTFDRFELEGGAVIAKAKGRVETPFQIGGMNALGLAGAELHGIIGYNILARYRLEFDFTKDKLTWTELNFDPGLPKGLGGKAGAPGGLDTLGAILKMLGAFLPKRPLPKYQYRGYLGIELSPAQDNSEGIVIKAVYAKSPAAAAGLQPGDRIVEIDEAEVSDLDDLQAYAAKLRSGRKMYLKINRQGKTRELVLTVGEGL